MDSSKITRRSLLASGAVGVLGTAGCLGIGQSEPPWKNEAEGGFEVKLGGLIPQSGSLGEFGPGLEQGIDLVEQQLSELVDLDYVLDVEIRDTESDPDTAVEAAQELVDEGYTALVGPGSVESAAAVTEEVLLPDEEETTGTDGSAGGAVAVSPLAGQGVDGSENRFYTVATPSRRISSGIGRPVSLNRIRSLSMIYADTEYGRYIHDNSIDMLEARGIEILEEVTIDPSDPSIDDVLEAAMADDPGGLIVACDPGEGIPLLEQYYNNYDPATLFLTDRLRLQDLPDRVDQDLVGENVVSLRPSWDGSADFGGGSSDDEDTEESDGGSDGDSDGTTEATDTPVPESDLLQPFDEAFQHANDRYPDLHDAQGYDAALLLTLSTIAAGDESATAGDIADRVEHVAYPENLRGQILTFGHANFWDGIGQIADGKRSYFGGASGTVRFDGDIRREAYLHVALFDPEQRSGFKDEFPLPP